jgi:NTP pyrophosphatase (non-canonical NTP hydrolase)
MDLTQLSKEIFEGNKEKGFWDNYFGTMFYIETDDTFSSEEAKAVRDAFISQKLMLITTEVGEAMEALRDSKFAKLDEYLDELSFTNKDNEYEVKRCFEDNIKNSFEDEIADSIIRLLDLSGALNIDIQKHIDLKLKYNKTRAHKHGKQF